MSNTLFAPKGAPVPEYRVRNIHEAYRLAGIEPPDDGKVVRDLIGSAEDPADVAARVAHDLHTNPADAERVYAEGVQAITAAEAKTALKHAYHRAEPTAGKQALSKLKNQAAADLRSAFEAAVKTLAEASAKLDSRRPLDAEAAVAADAGQALVNAREAVRKLAVFAAIHDQPARPANARALTRLLPILNLPENIVVEQCYRNFGHDIVTANEDDLGPARTVRAILTDGKADIDSTVVRIAAGYYPGASLALPTVAELSERVAEAERALARETIEAPSSSSNTPVFLRR